MDIPKEIPPSTIRTQQMATKTGPAAPVSRSAQCSTLLKHRIARVPESRIRGILSAARMSDLVVDKMDVYTVIFQGFNTAARSIALL
jgi:hypothetical protein